VHILSPWLPKTDCICFGDVINNQMVLNYAGFVAQKCWLEIPSHFPHAQLDEFIVMPNHIHGIIVICDNDHVGAKNFSPLQHRWFLSSCVRDAEGGASVAKRQHCPEA
jgi:REP element-mobilizing transposase RayT